MQVIKHKRGNSMPYVCLIFFFYIYFAPLKMTKNYNKLNIKYINRIKHLTPPHIDIITITSKQRT